MSDWQLIATAPRDGSPLILGFREPGQRKRPRKSYVCTGEFFHEAWWGHGDFEAGEGSLDPQPTHWMPLPEPPK